MWATTKCKVTMQSRFERFSGSWNGNDEPAGSLYLQLTCNKAYNKSLTNTSTYLTKRFRSFEFPVLLLTVYYSICVVFIFISVRSMTPHNSSLLVTLGGFRLSRIKWCLGWSTWPCQWVSSHLQKHKCVCVVWWTWLQSHSHCASEPRHPGCRWFRLEEIPHSPGKCRLWVC